ncbi:MAG: hypothetical protein ABSA47_16610 [Verrucomicrobiota bacterium]
MVAPLEARARGVTPSSRVPAIIPLDARQAQKVGPRQVLVEHKPDKRGILLVKIIAMETYSGNVERLDRRRQFCKRFGAPSKS